MADGALERGGQMVGQNADGVESVRARWQNNRFGGLVPLEVSHRLQIDLFALIGHRASLSMRPILLNPGALGMSLDEDENA